MKTNMGKTAKIALTAGVALGAALYVGAQYSGVYYEPGDFEDDGGCSSGNYLPCSAHGYMDGYDECEDCWTNSCCVCECLASPAISWEGEGYCVQEKGSDAYCALVQTRDIIYDVNYCFMTGDCSWWC